MKRLFKFKNKVTIITIILFSLFFVISLVLGCLEPTQYIYWLVAGIIVVFFVSMALVGYFTPIVYNDKIVRYGKREINWEDVRIVAYPMPSNSINKVYYLILDTEYLKGAQAKQVVKQKFYVCLSVDSLRVISLYYKQKILILDCDKVNFTDNLQASDKLKQALLEHNAKCS